MIPLLLLLAITGLMQAARSFSAIGPTGGTELAFGFLLLVAYFTAKIVNRAGLQRTFGGDGKTGVAAFGNSAATIVVGVVAVNEMIAPVILRMMLIRSGEAGKKQGVDFAAGGH